MSLVELCFAVGKKRL
uniref:Uncharacterized protein n=1 Tax=Anguilla anguilla TaxID=7936 RepID=A0A0E9UC28_ANGAN